MYSMLQSEHLCCVSGVVSKSTCKVEEAAEASTARERPDTRTRYKTASFDKTERPYQHLSIKSVFPFKSNPHPKHQSTIKVTVVMPFNYSKYTRY